MAQRMHGHDKEYNRDKVNLNRIIPINDTKKLSLIKLES